MTSDPSSPAKSASDYFTNPTPFHAVTPTATAVFASGLATTTRVTGKHVQDAEPWFSELRRHLLLYAK